MSTNPLGKDASYPTRYAPELLCAISRADARAVIGLRGALPFTGEDIWNAYELTWLDESGKPVVATATLRVRAESEYLFESKSLKLYLNSFAMESLASADALCSLLIQDLSKLTEKAVGVTLTTSAESDLDIIGSLPGTCLDEATGDFSAAAVDPSLLAADGENLVEEELHSHLLRSNCPVTNQPDLGSVLVRYSGPKIDRSALLRYIVSFREHNDFHEACVERMFCDIKNRCRASKLTISAHYTRRGGIDINPFRSDFESAAAKLRLWRQ